MNHILQIQLTKLHVYTKRLLTTYKTTCFYITVTYYRYALLYNFTVTEKNHEHQLHGMDYQIIFKLQASMIYFCSASKQQQIYGIQHICHVIFTVHSACLLINATCIGRTVVIWVPIQTSI
jgi:hypothetical protein